MSVRPAKTQISLGISPVSSLSTQWVAKDPSFLHADSEDSDQTGRCPGWSESLLGAQSLYWFCHVTTHHHLSHYHSVSEPVLQMYYCWDGFVIITIVIYQILPDRLTVSIRPSWEVLCYNEHYRVRCSLNITGKYGVMASSKMSLVKRKPVHPKSFEVSQDICQTDRIFLQVRMKICRTEKVCL